MGLEKYASAPKPADETSKTFCKLLKPYKTRSVTVLLPTHLMALQLPSIFDLPDSTAAAILENVKNSVSLTSVRIIQYLYAVS